ncbi:MAG: Lrp/AsnC family transcriptional regulator [Lentisphaeria bacterium]|nr:Lrp/AsnC family transcriptional regulator [Lentisphaeria bacterium]NQZ69529.1 Lrp/AsnC family transcriptional regulator [Lentisphaeria bacterium]
MVELDKTDRDIIAILSEENTTNNAIAEKLKITEGTVRQRIKKLREAGVLKIRGLINPEILENQQLAFIMITLAEARLLDSKATEISQLNQVLSVSLITGRYDLLIEVIVESNKGLVNFLTDELSQINGIAHSETFMSLKSINKFI